MTGKPNTIRIGPTDGSRAGSVHLAYNKETDQIRLRLNDEEVIVALQDWVQMLAHLCVVTEDVLKENQP